MATLLTFPGSRDALSGNKIRALRQRHSLSLTQAACALEISASTLDAWEANGRTSVVLEELEERYAAFAASVAAGIVHGKNLLFGAFPLRAGREILNMDVAAIAKRLGYTPDGWRKLESNSRLMRPEAKDEFEALVRARMATLCT